MGEDDETQTMVVGMLCHVPLLHPNYTIEYFASLSPSLSVLIDLGALKTQQ